MVKLYIYPRFEGEDKGDGGVRRVVDMQRRMLTSKTGVTVVDDPGDADVLASHITISDALLRRFPDKPLVAHCHGLYWSEYEWEDWAYKANTDVMRLVCAADVVTAPSEWVARVIRRHTSRDVRVVYHGIDGREWQMAASTSDYVLWNKTRVDPVCDPEPLARLAEAMPEQRFLTTYGPNLPNVERIGRMGYEEGKSLIRHAAVYLATTRETFGIGTIEAMACGVPVVGYAIGAQPEIIDHGVNGWLVEPGDIDGLAEGVRWARDPANAGIIAERARDKILNTFSWQPAMDAYRAIYREVAERYVGYTHNPRTTIIVPAYNLEKYLPDTIQSVIDQTDDSWECIIVDDASPDKCGEIADAVAAKDKRFRVIHNETNQYLAEARNIAIREARGRYILPVDADDKLHPRAVEVLSEALDADKTLHVAYGNVLFTDEDGVTPTNYNVSGQTPGHSGWPPTFDAVRQVQGWNFLPYSSMYRREVWQVTGGYRRRLRTAEDADFWTRVASYGFNVQQVTTADTLIYRNRPGSMSRTEDAKRFQYRRWFPWSKDLSLAPGPISGPRGISLLTPRVAVVIPVGPGHEKVVQDAVDSVAAQSYRLWECIVVNDTGSPLELPAWAQVIECDARDVSVARNMGIAAATAGLFIPLDADDFLQPDALQWLVTAHTETEGHIIYCDFYEDPEKAGEYKPFTLRDWTCDDLLRRGCVHSVVALTPVAAWKSVGGYATGINWEDWDFQIRCAEAGFCSSHLTAPLFTYRKHTGGRRDYDGDEFERRKAAMLARWGDYFHGRKRLMACGCNSKRITPAEQAQAQANARALAGGQGAVLVEYTGSKVGSVRYRGPSKTVYAFAAGDPPKYVLPQDVSAFQGRPDFRIVPATAIAAAVEPVLV